MRVQTISEQINTKMSDSGQYHADLDDAKDNFTLMGKEHDTKAKAYHLKV